MESTNCNYDIMNDINHGIFLTKAELLFNETVSKSYLSKLSSLEVLPYSGGNKGIRWYRITKIVYEKGVFFTDKMSMLYASLHNVCSVVSLALRKKDEKIELFLGTRDEKGSDFISGKLLESGIKGILPGIEIKNEYDINLLNDFEENETSVAAVSGVASLTDDKKEKFIQGIENLINSTKDINIFTALIIANKVSNAEANEIKSAFENLYSDISPLAQVQMSCNVSESEGITKTITEGFNNSVSQNISRTISHGSTEGSSKSNSITTNNGPNIIMRCINMIFGGEIGSSEGGNISRNFSTQTNEADQTGENTQQGKHHDESDARSNTRTDSKNTQITRQNRYIKSCMDVIDKQITRIQKSTSSGLWSVATYFIANNDTTCLELAGIYRGIIVGENSEVETVSINLWPRDENRYTIGNPKVKEIVGYLSNQMHPRFKYLDNINYTAGTLVDSRELAIHLSLPQSSVPGLLVREEKTFGRNVKSIADISSERNILIGNIVHLGDIYKDKVRLRLSDLSKHSLVVGTTGSGKSNTLYLMLSEMAKQGIHFLVIEPAKGEYKEIFGTANEIGNVSVYGTNPRMTELLTINPFVFPTEIDVYEHIDSLVEIFNACWPMYAAMPQVLKHAIIEAYKACGWDMDNSYNTYSIFPTVGDVLYSLREYMNSSEYSSDTKGDYKGSLETRLQSLCDGTLGRIFRGKPISDEILFNKNTIVDLSRVQSSEMKSLLMGILLMKLNEYRLSENNSMNQELRHVTILEEAHHLLKKTSTEQSSESSNVAGMAIERISNSMAEMRTYGEGFIIVDQSPSMLDTSTIRNTNTKIIMSLPEKGDRDIAGKSIGLDDSHLNEISRLKTGEAIVFQNGWEEPVKTLISKYEMTTNEKWHFSKTFNIEECSLSDLFGCLYNLYAINDVNDEDVGFRELVLRSALSGIQKMKILEILDNSFTLSANDCAKIMVTIVGVKLFCEVSDASDFISLNDRLRSELQTIVGMQQYNHISTFVDMYVRGCRMVLKQSLYEEWILNKANMNLL